MGDTAKVSLGDGAQIAVPSGENVTLQDIIWNSDGPLGPVARFRFVAPQIARLGGSVTSDQVTQDLRHLCETFVLARLGEQGPLPSNVIVSIADRPVNFGDSVPEATQFFESYRIDGTSCISELF